MTRPPFAANLAALLELHAINQAELARRVRVSIGTVSRWLSTGRIPGGQDLLAVARVLAVDPWVLLGSSFEEPLPTQPRRRAGRPPTRSTA